MTRISYFGNFRPEHSTENHVAQALIGLGHDVRTWQEDDELAWEPHWLSDYEPQVILWTRTASLSPAEALSDELLRWASRQRIPTVALHLDRWWGLAREHDIRESPFFRCSYVFTADGGHDLEFAEAGVRHRWMPPAVSAWECHGGRFNPDLASDIAFVGSWQGGYHEEWRHRQELVEWLQATYGERCRFWPQPGQPAVRGQELRDLYRSVKVVVGDSCLVPNRDGSAVERYWSDRVPETIGRGGLLIHPHVAGIEDCFLPGAHGLLTWRLGDWEMLRSQIEWALAHEDSAGLLRRDGRRRVLREHTYSVRLRQVLEQVGVA